MLRHKLLKILLYEAALLMVLAVAALWSLHGLFVRLDTLYAESHQITHESNNLNRAISTIQLELYALQSGHTQRLDPIILAFDRMRRAVDSLGEHQLLQDADIAPAYESLSLQLDAFERRAASLATWQDPRVAREQNLASLSLAASLRNAALQITDYVYAHLEREQGAITARFRGLVIGLAAGFLLVVNASIILLVRTSQMVLRPVEQLVEASRELAKENFNHRVNLGQQDEFDELGAAYNHLAEQLGANEQRRLETLGQVALTLNHELNNAVAIIELQLTLMRRRSDNAPAFERSLHEIHQSLRRMARVIEALKHVRRIVLTDYVGGVKMLDLERSVQEDADEASATVAGRSQSPAGSA